MAAGVKAKRTVSYIFLIISLIISLWKWEISGKAFTACGFLLFLILAAVRDLRTKHIPDRFVLGAGTAGMLSALFFTEISLAGRAVGAVSVSLLLLIITLIVPGSFGGGDIKLMAVSGIFLGWEYNLRAFVLAVFLAGAYCIGMLLKGKLTRKARIAFGPFLCIGIVLEIFIVL